jgi:hypothetical protein
LTQEALLAELDAHPHAAAMRAAVRHHAFGAARARNAKLISRGRQVGPISGEPPQLTGLQRDALTTSHGNVADALERGPCTVEEWTLLSALLADALRHDVGAQALDQTAADLVWLATHTRCDALAWTDTALADRATPLWDAVARIASEPEASGLERAEALVAAAALSASPAMSARHAAARAEAMSRDAAVRGLLQSPSRASAAAEPLRGELSPRPYGPVGTALLAATLILFVMRVGRVVGKLALAYKNPAEMRLSSRGLELEYRTELFGRVLRDRSVLVPVHALSRVTREVRYPRTGMYAGLLALVLGSYFGMGLLVDGLRVPGGSPPLLGLALALIGVGVLVDFALTSLTDGVKGRCRVVVVPLKGRTVCIGGLDPQRTDAMLSAIAERSVEPRPAA